MKKKLQTKYEDESCIVTRNCNSYALVVHLKRREWKFSLSPEKGVDALVETENIYSLN